MAMNNITSTNMKLTFSMHTEFVNTGILPDIASNAWDGYCATTVAEAGTKALATGQKQPINLMPKPEFYTDKKGIAT